AQSVLEQLVTEQPVLDCGDVEAGDGGEESNLERNRGRSGGRSRDNDHGNSSSHVHLEEEKQEKKEEEMWRMVFGRQFSEANPKAAVALSVALMRLHQGTVSEQKRFSDRLSSSLSTSVLTSVSTLVGTGRSAGETACFLGQDSGKASGRGIGHPEGGERRHNEHNGWDVGEEKGGGELVSDPWLKYVLCRESMVHGFYQAAYAGLMDLRKRGGAGAGGVVWAWTGVLGRIAAAETLYSSSPDQVAAHACAAHEILLASQELSVIPVGIAGRERRLWAGQARGTSTYSSASGGSQENSSFSFQYRYLEARAELLQLLGASWAMCQDLSVARNSRFARHTRKEGRLKRLPAAFRHLARMFRMLRGPHVGDMGETGANFFPPYPGGGQGGRGGGGTVLPLRAASSLCLLLAVAADLLLNQSKSCLGMDNR
ncbi:unnamed protein product, partial [Discosporangium mesarthrocarpum]